jgi:peptide/nickel transport system substrate-binding protein
MHQSPEPRPVKGGVVTWACNPGFPPSTIFPFTPPERIGTRNLFEFQMLMYRPLYWLGRDGQPVVDPDRSLAEPPQWSEDGRTVTVRLKPWRWSNGEPICADNVLFWVNMMAVKGPRYGSYAPGYFPDNLASYEKVADDTVRFTFDKAYSRRWVHMNQLSLITPMPRAWDRFADDRPANASADIADVPAVYDYLVSQNGPWTEESNEVRTRWANSPVWSVVSGPWRLKSYTLNGTVTFVPNESYSGPDRPYLDEFRQVPIASDDEMLRRLTAGPDAPNGVHIGYLPYGMEEDLTAGGANPVGQHYRLTPQHAFCIRYMPFNFDNPNVNSIFRQTYFRQALQCTLDQETAIRDIYHGHAYRTSGPVPMMPDTEFVSPTQRTNPVGFDLDRARQLLADNGWDVTTTPAVCVRPGSGPGCAGEGIKAGDTLSFTLRYVEGRMALRRLMEQLRDNAATVGIELILEDLYGSTMIGQDHAEEAPDNPRRWELNCWNGGWAFYGHFTGEMLFKSGAASNWGGYSDPTADRLIESTVVSDDIEALYEYQDYLAEHVPAVWIPGFPMRLLEVAKNLRGVEPFNPYGVINPENWYYVEE